MKREGPDDFRTFPTPRAPKLTTRIRKSVGSDRPGHILTLADFRTALQTPSI